MAKLVKNIFNAVVDAVVWVWEAAVDIVEWTWDNVAGPILEGAFALIGIKAETVVQAEKVSTKIMGNDTSNTIYKTQVKAVLEYVNSTQSFFPVYMRNMGMARSQVNAFYRFGQKRYVHGLPSMSVKGKLMDAVAIKAAVETDLGITATIISANQTTPFFRDRCNYYLQSAPYNYKPGQNLITHQDSWGNDREWSVDLITDNTSLYAVDVSRTASRMYFWLYGPATVVEGENVTYTIYASEPVPTGMSIPINLIYSGSAVDGVDYTSVAQVVMLADTSSIQFTISTIENTDAHVARNFVVELGDIDNSGDVFDDPVIYQPGKAITTNIIDDEGIILTMPFVMVNEDVTSVTVQVTLENAATGAFTVDYSFTDGSATGLIGGGAGSDYDSTSGTLNFAGTTGETQDIVIPITPDVVDDDQENFTINLTNCSDGAVTLTNTTVIIWDGTDDQASHSQALTDSFDLVAFSIANRVVVRYHETSNPSSDWYIWHYDVTTGVYPDVEFREQDFANLDLLPIAILRRNKVNLAEADPNYRSTKLLLGRLQMNLEDILSNIDSDENPQTDVDDCYLNFAISPSDNNRIVSKIMFKTFHLLHVTNGLYSDINEYKAIFIEQDIQNALIWAGFEWSENKVGTLGIPVGEYTHTVVPKSGTGESEVPSKLILQYRKADNSYNELVITALASLSSVAYSGFHKVVLKNLEDTALTIPVSHWILKDLEFREILEVYGYMLRIDFNALVITELEYYQTQKFADFFEFVMLVITVVSLGSASSLTALATTVVTRYLLIELVMYIADVTGNEVLAAVVGVIAAIAVGSVNGVDFGGLMDAESLLKVTTEFAQNYAVSAGVSMQKLQGDIEDFTKQYEAKLGLIEDAEEDLDQNIDIAFVMGLQSVSTQLYKAIQNQYDYDTVFNGPEIAVSNFVDTQLSKSRII